MRYTEEKNRDINNKLNSIKRRIIITNMKAQAHKLLKNDGKIDDNYKDFNDLKDDEFKRKALFNEYARKIIGNYGNISELEERLTLEGNDLIHYFLNNYPRVLQEVKMYSAPTVDNLYNVIRKLYNREIKELDLIEDKNNDDTNVKSTLGLLKKISSNLKDLKKFAYTENQRHDLLDLQKKFEAVMTVLENVDDGVKFMATLFNMKFPDVQKSLENTALATSVPSDPNAPVPIIDTQLQTPTPIGSIQPNTLTELLNRFSNTTTPPKNEKQNDALEYSGPVQTPTKQIDNQDDDEEFFDAIDQSNQQLQFSNDIMDDSIIDEAKYYSEDDTVSKADYVEYISKILNESKNAVKSKGGTKAALFKYFQKELEKKRDKISQEEAEKKRIEDYNRQNEEMRLEEEQKYKQQHAQIGQNMEQLKELENEVIYLEKINNDAQQKVVGVAQARNFYNTTFRHLYNLPAETKINSIRAIISDILNERRNLYISLKNQN
jgi:hypothetical protein